MCSGTIRQPDARDVPAGRREGRGPLRSLASRAPGCLNDLHRFDVRELSWTELVAPPAAQRGSWPSPRGGFGFAALGSSLYMFGGADDNGGRLAPPAVRRG